MPDEETKPLETKVGQELEIDETRLEAEIARQPSKFHFYGSLWARASKKVRKEKLRVRALEASLCKSYRSKMLTEDPKLRLTERVLDDYLSEEPSWVEAKRRLIELEYMETMLELAKDGFRQRHQALIELHKTRGEEKYYGNVFENMTREFEATQGQIPRGKRSKSKGEENGK
jgi:hypothetical protein